LTASRSEQHAALPVPTLTIATLTVPDLVSFVPYALLANLKLTGSLLGLILP
jgi:multiple sugar transport system permease protein